MRYAHLIVLLFLVSIVSARCGNLEVLDKNFSLSIQQPNSATLQMRVFVEEWQSYIPPLGCNLTTSISFPAMTRVSASIITIPTQECPKVHCLDVYCPNQSSNCFISLQQGAANITFELNASAENATGGEYDGQIIFRDSSPDTLGKESVANVTLLVSFLAGQATPTPVPTTGATVTPAATPTATPAPLIPTAIPLPAPPSVTFDQVLLAVAAGIIFLLVAWWQFQKSREESF